MTRNPERDTERPRVVRARSPSLLGTAFANWDSFCQLVYKFFEDFVCPSSRRQETQWVDVDTIEVARGIKTTRQPVFSDDLEATEAANARLVTEPYIARDKNNVPILGYFPAVLHGPTVHKTHIALSAYIDELSAERATWAEKRAKKNDEKEVEKDAAGITSEERQKSNTRRRGRKAPAKEHKSQSSPTVPDSHLTEKEKWSWPWHDHRHPPNEKLLNMFGFRYALQHLGTWLATGHPYDDPVVSSDFIKNATWFSRSWRLFQNLGSLTYELSILFAAFDSMGWSHARRFIAALAHFHGHTQACMTDELECWAHRAFLFNQETRAHRDARDNRFGYAVLTTFGAFMGGEFVVPQLGLKFRHQPGDVIFIRGHQLCHFITPWEPEGDNGERFCITHFTHQSLIDSVAKSCGVEPETESYDIEEDSDEADEVEGYDEETEDSDEEM